MQCRRLGFSPWVRKITWRRKWQPTPVSLPGKSHGQRSLAVYSPRGCKSQTRFSNWTTTREKTVKPKWGCPGAQDWYRPEASWDHLQRKYRERRKEGKDRAPNIYKCGQVKTLRKSVSKVGRKTRYVWYMEALLVFYICYNKLLQTEWLKQQKLIFL